MNRTEFRITTRKLAVVLCGILIAACRNQDSSGFDPEKLFVDVFAPQEGETVLFIVDLPTRDEGDYPGWEDRRSMAQEWRDTVAGMEEELGVSVYPLATYQATGAHNGPLPDELTLGGEQVPFREILSETNVAVVMSEYSATAPMIEYTHRFPDLRVASMPMVSRSMQTTALAADYAAISKNCRILRNLLDEAVGAQVEFSTGHEMYFDLRYRNAEVDDGRLDGQPGGARVINLPSGEAYIAPYEGEIDSDPSRTLGMLPVVNQSDGSYAIAVIEENQIVDVRDGTSPEFAADGRKTLDQDQALRNVAELGLGCNPSAVTTGNVLEDEKVVGMHWALGRSDHIGGTVGPEDFDNPELVTHLDFVYPLGAKIAVSTLTLEYADGSNQRIIEDGKNVILSNGSSQLVEWSDALLAWFLIAAVCWSWVAWDAERFAWTPPSRIFLWAFAALILGPLGLWLYYRSPQRTRNPQSD